MSASPVAWIIQAMGDADIDIVKATVDSIPVCSTTLIGEDKYLLILLLYYAKTENEMIYFRSDTKQSTESQV